jgi:hypothetical protein
VDGVLLKAVDALASHWGNPRARPMGPSQRPERAQRSHSRTQREAAQANPHRAQQLRSVPGFYDLKRACGGWLNISPGKTHNVLSLLSRCHPIMKDNQFTNLLGALLDDKGIERRRIVLDAVPSDEL